MATGTIDLSQIPLPDAVEVIDSEIILTEWISLLTTKDPAYTGLVESDPAYIQGEAVTYRETVLRQRVNEAVRATFLATAVKNDLDVKAADYGVRRLLIDPGDQSSIPPREPVYELDDALRHRTWLSMQALSTAGPYGAYQYFALSADPDVLDAIAYGPEDHDAPGEVHVYVLSRTGDGTASQLLQDVVLETLNADDVRPLTDYVSVISATVKTYTVEAVLHIKPGPSADSVLQAAMEAQQAYADSTHRIGHIVGRSGIDRALHQPGVEYVTLTSPATDLLPGMGEVYYCSAINITVATGEV